MQTTTILQGYDDLVREKIVTCLDYYPVLSATLLRYAFDTGDVDLPVLLDELTESRRIVRIVPTGSGHMALRYCLPQHVTRLGPFLQTPPRIRYSTREERHEQRIIQRFQLFPIMITSLLAAALQSTGSLYSETLDDLVTRGVLTKRGSTDGRRGERYYLSAYENLLQPWLERETMG